MTLTIPFTGRRERPRKANRAEVKLARTREHLAAVQEDNGRLLNMKAAADDHFMLMAQYVTDLEDDVRRLKAQVAEEQGARAVAEKDAETRGRWVADLERQLADAKRRLDIRSLAESAAAKTQEIPVVTRVLPLSQAPFASVDPTHVPASALHT